MTDEEKRAIEVFQSVEKSQLSPAEVDQHTRDINLMAANSKLTVIKPETETQRPITNAKPKPNGELDFKAMVGKTFVRKSPGIYVGATYEVKAINGDQFQIARHDSGENIFEFTMRTDLFDDLMELPKEKPAPVAPPKEPEKPHSPWAETEKKKK